MHKSSSETVKTGIWITRGEVCAFLGEMYYLWKQCKQKVVLKVNKKINVSIMGAEFHKFVAVKGYSENNSPKASVKFY